MKKQEDKKWIWITGSTILICFLMYLFIPTYSMFGKYREQKRILTSRIEELTQENEDLKQEIKKLRNDPLYIEKIARKELGMMRPGEIIYRIEEK